jgi:hypothetical protein
MILENKVSPLSQMKMWSLGMPKLFGDLAMELEHAVFAVGGHEVSSDSRGGASNEALARRVAGASEERKRGCSV